MPCDKTTERLEEIGFWDYLMGNVSPLEEDVVEESLDNPQVKEVWYNYRYNPITREVEYQSPPSEKWRAYP